MGLVIGDAFMAFVIHRPQRGPWWRRRQTANLLGNPYNKGVIWSFTCFSTMKFLPWNARLGWRRTWSGAVAALLLFLPVLHASAQPAELESSAGNPDRIYVSVGVLDVDAISSASQSFTINIYVQFRWQDPALAHEGPGHLRRNLNEIAAPRFLLVNRQRTWSTLLNVVDISPAGEAAARTAQ